MAGSALPRITIRIVRHDEIVVDPFTNEVLRLRVDPDSGAKRLWWRQPGSRWTLVERSGVAPPRSLARELPVPLRLVIFSDCRAQELELVLDWVRVLEPRPHLILYAGDDIERFVHRGARFLEAFAREAVYGLAAVLGNDDRPSLRAHLEADGVHDVHATPIALGELVIGGLEGSPFRREGPISALQYREAVYAEHLGSLEPYIIGRPTILLSHTPPRGVLDLAQRFGRHHIGTEALRGFLARRPEVALVACGHVHKEGGQHVAVGPTTVLNAASHDGIRDAVRIATVALVPGEVPLVTWTELHGLDGIFGLWPAYRRKVRAGGIRTVDDVVAAGAERIAQLLGWKVASAKRIVARADALRRKAPVACAPLVIPAGPRIYLDIETDHLQSYVWLIGVYEEQGRRFAQFLARTPAQEPKILRQFASWLQERPDAVLLAYSGSQFDERILKKRFAARKLRIPEPLARALDLKPVIERAVGVPTSYLKLKEVARSIGYRYKDPDLDGWAVASAYMQALAAGRPVPKRLLDYNRDDVLSLKFLIDTVEPLARVEPPGSPACYP